MARHHLVTAEELERMGEQDFGYELVRGLARSPDTVRGPDVAFISRERRAALGGRRRGFIPGAPDLAVEIRSADATLSDLSTKAGDYLAAGTRLVWLVDPPSQTVQVHEPGREPRVLVMGAVLEGGEVLPGLTLPLAELFSEE